MMITFGRPTFADSLALRFGMTKRTTSSSSTAAVDAVRSIEARDRRGLER
jgi:hypothetical protein